MSTQNVCAARNPVPGRRLAVRGAIRATVLVAALMMAGPIVIARAADAPATPAARTFTDGQKVEVREGDEWSAATILKREGRKYQVHYEGADAGAADEWVTADRIRLPGAAAPAPAVKPATPAGKEPAADAAPATKPPKAAPPVANWPLRANVEAKWGGLFRKATIVNRRGDWYLVNWDNGPFEEWVEPWRIRKLGSTDDPYGYASPNTTMHKGKPVGNPPTERPGPPPNPNGVAAGGGKDNDNGKSLESEQTPLTDVNRAAAQDVVLGGSDVDAMKLAPDAEPKSAKPPVAQPIVLRGGTGEFFDHAKGLYFTSPETGLVASVHANEPPGKPADVRVERIDLSTGRSLGNSSLPVACEPLDLSPDGKLFIARSNVFGFGGSGRLDVWQVEGGGAANAAAKHVVSFVPFASQQPVNRDIKWAQFVDADHVLVLAGGGTVGLFDLRGVKEVWSAQAEGTTIPALSAGHKYLAVSIKGGEVAIVDAMSGKTQGRLSVEGGFGVHLSFKPDGTQLAAASLDQLTIWDLTTGRRAYDLTPVGASGNQIAWPADGFVLLDGQYLVALEKKMVVWSYQPEAGNASMQGTTYAGRYWYVAPGGGNAGKPVLVSVNLPNEPARRAAIVANPDNDLLVHPGSTVSLDVALPGDIQDKSLAGIKQRLQANGVTVADNAPIKLVARSEPGESREIEYRSFGGPFGQTSKVTATGVKNDIHLETADGKILWERKGTTFPPPMLMMKKDQTVDEAVAEAMKPSPLFFSNARIPKYVPKNKAGLGVSRLTSAGIQNANVPGL